MRRVRFWSKTDALEKLAKHLSMLVDRHQVDAKGGFTLNVKVAPLEPKEAGDHESSRLASDAVVDVEKALGPSRSQLRRQ